MSSAFGVKTDCQTNPDDPVIAKARRAMSPSALQKYLLPILAILPFGQLLLQRDFIFKAMFSNTFEIIKVARDMIDVKRKGGVSGRNVSFEDIIIIENRLQTLFGKPVF